MRVLPPMGLVVDFISVLVVKHHLATYRLHQLVMNRIHQEHPFARVASFKLLRRENSLYDSGPSSQGSLQLLMQIHCN
jgi:hypothetical protein